jgi:hypothetical protein
MSPDTSTTQGRRQCPLAAAWRWTTIPSHLADIPGRRHARITTRLARSIPAFRRAPGRSARGNRPSRPIRAGRRRVPTRARPAPATGRPAAFARPGRDPPVPHPRFRAALRRRDGPGPACGSGAGFTGRDRCTSAARGNGTARSTGRAAWLAEPVRPGAGRDAGRIPSTASAGAVDHRARPRTHQAARASALGRAAAACPAGGDLPSHRRRHGDGRGGRLRAARPRAGRPARAGRWYTGRRRAGRPGRQVAVRGGRGGLEAAAGQAGPPRLPRPEPPGARARGDQPAGRLRGSPWHSLYFFPEPQGHGALRPTLPNSPPLAVSERRSTCAPPSTVGAV